ncbi:serine hydrolase [Arthrobacter sp. Soil736]|nr:serine hydrolase [Arthrobacter sp. Soil736]
MDPVLEAQVSGIIRANAPSQVGVALIDMADGIVHEYGVREKFVAASTGKVLAAATYYHLAESGLVSLAAPMGGSTAEVHLRRMIQQSDNQSWGLILGAIGYQGIQDYAASIGITYDRVLNTLTAAETARILALLFGGRLLSGANTAQLLSYMQYTNYESLIPAAVPAGINVFHKYGLLDGNLHDAAILVQDTRAYVLVVYTLGHDAAGMPGGAGIIHQVTQAVAAKLF